MDRRNEGRSGAKERDTGFEQELLQRFLERHQPIPQRPPYSRTSTMIIRKGMLPFYFAIYDHDRFRFVELQYRMGREGPLLSIRIPEGTQPPVHG